MSERVHLLLVRKFLHQDSVTMAHVVHAEVDSGLVGDGAYHQVYHGLEDIYAVPPYPVLSSSVDPFFLTVILMSTMYFIISYRILPIYATFILHLLIIVLPTCVVVGSYSLLYLNKNLGHSVLLSILIPFFLLQVVN